MTSVPMTAEEALATAKAEGLALVHTDSKTGYKGVFFNPRRPRMPYELQIRVEGGNTSAPTPRPRRRR